MVGIISEGGLLEVIKELYGLPTSGNSWNAHLLHTLREMGFRPYHFNPDAWIRWREEGYNYIETPNNDVLIVAVNPTCIFNKLKETYTIKTSSPPKVHLGCDYSQVKKGNNTLWFLGISTYTA